MADNQRQILLILLIRLVASCYHLKLFYFKKLIYFLIYVFWTKNNFWEA